MPLWPLPDVLPDSRPSLRLLPALPPPTGRRAPAPEPSPPRPRRPPPHTFSGGEASPGHPWRKPSGGAALVGPRLRLATHLCQRDESAVWRDRGTIQGRGTILSQREACRWGEEAAAGRAEGLLRIPALLRAAPRGRHEPTARPASPHFVQGRPVTRDIMVSVSLSEPGGRRGGPVLTAQRASLPNVPSR